MAITVGTDTYISVVDATTYMAANYLSTDAKLIAWNALSDANKEVLLRKAARQIDQLPIVGYKELSTQTMAFPRVIYTSAGNELQSSSTELYDDWFTQASVPVAVQNAQCEIAIDYLNESTRKKLQREGVKSFSLGNLSESYGSGTTNALPYEAQRLMQPYIAGSVAIC